MSYYCEQKIYHRDDVLQTFADHYGYWICGHFFSLAEGGAESDSLFADYLTGYDDAVYILPQQYIGVNNEKNKAAWELFDGQEGIISSSSQKGMIKELSKVRRFRNASFELGDYVEVLNSRFAGGFIDPEILFMDTCGTAKAGGELVGKAMRSCDTWKQSGKILIAVNIIYSGRDFKTYSYPHESINDFIEKEYSHWSLNWERLDKTYIYKGAKGKNTKMITYYFCRKSNFVEPPTESLVNKETYARIASYYPYSEIEKFNKSLKVITRLREGADLEVLLDEEAIMYKSFRGAYFNAFSISFRDKEFAKRRKAALKAWETRRKNAAFRALATC